MALRGTLDTFALPDVLRLLGATSKTGRLRITGDRGTGSVWVSGGQIASVDATHAPHAHGAVEALFELLRFRDGSFTFDAGATDGAGSDLSDVEHLLVESEQLLGEWREIEAVIPSLDLWVTLQRTLPSPEVTLDERHWATIVAVGAGATVRRIGDELCQGELPVSRAVKDLVEAGLAEIAEVAPIGAAWASPATSVEAPRPLIAPDALDDATDPDERWALEPDEARHEAELEAEPGLDPEPEPVGPAAEVVVPEPEPVLPVAPAVAAPAPRAVSGPRARRARGASALPPVPSEPGLFVPLDLPGHGGAPSYDDRPTEPVAAPDPAPASTAAEPDLAELDELAAAFPGLAHREPVVPVTDAGPLDAAEVDDEVDDEELAAHLARLSPRAAKAIRAAAAASGEAGAEGGEGESPPLSRGLLLKFLSSVKS